MTELQEALLQVERAAHEYSADSEVKGEQSISEAMAAILLLIGAWWAEKDDYKGLRRTQELEKRIGAELDKLYSTLEKSLTTHLETVLSMTVAGIIAAYGWPKFDYALDVSDKWHYDGSGYAQILANTKAKMLHTFTQLAAQWDRTGGTLDNLKRCVGRYERTMANNLKTLTETESRYFQSKAAKLAYNNNGVTQFRFIAVIDDRTSEMCRKMDMKVFPMDEWEVGVTVPPLHPNCRSTVEGIIPR